jgi:Tol biopolymer transport system component
MLARLFCISLSILLLCCANSDTDSPVKPPIDFPYYPEIDKYPSWSPDGSKVIYYHRGIIEINENGGYHINPDSSGLWMINSDGTNSHIIWHSRFSVESTWSHDGEWIAVSSYAHIFKFKLQGDHIDSTSVEQLTTAGRNFCPSWSSDGKWIVFDSNADGSYSIWKMRYDGSSKTRIISGRSPDWSSIEDNIVYIVISSSKLTEIFTANSNGENVVQLTDSNFGSNCPEYSPDGMRVAYVSDKKIWIINTDGSDQRSVIGNVVSCGVTWSPDGNEIAFVRYSPDNRNNNGTIWIVNVDGSDLRQLTSGLGLNTNY